jgi:hypothetical protein
MKAVMLSKQEVDYVDYHLIDGLDARIKGIVQLQDSNLITLEESHELIVRASMEHVTLWRTFKMKLMAKALCVLFAAMFGYLQISGEDLDMRRSSRKGGRRRSENENVITL